MKYWLIKSEPDCYSIDDFKRDKKASWSGVRNYQARNFMKEMQVGDLALFWHSGGNPPSAVGLAKVVKEAHPDATALDKKDDHYDPKHTKAKPMWYAVDFGYAETFKSPVSISLIKANPKLAGMLLTQQGSRLSVQPVSPAHFKTIQKLGKE